MADRDGGSRKDAGGTDPDPSRLWAHPLTRRRFLYAAGSTGAMAALAPLLASCTSSGSSTTTQSPHGGVQIKGQIPGPGPVSGGTYGGKVVAGYGRPYDNNDPALGVDLFSYDIITNFVFFGAVLAFQGQTGPPMANLAELPEVSQDKKTLTFALRDVMFHNGRLMTADDVKWSLERVVQPETGSWGSSYFNAIVGAKDVADGKTKTIEGIEVVDAKTFKIHLVDPNFTILYALSQPFAAPVPREEVERLGSKFGKTPVGYGPFKMDTFDENGQVAHLVKFDDYFYEGLPYIDEIEMRWGADYETLLLQFKSKAIDVIADGISGSTLGQARTDPAIASQLQTVKILQSYSWQFNVDLAPFDDVKVRQALNWAVNRDDIAKILHGAGVADGKPFPLGIEGYTSTFEGYGYDPDKARQLLQEAGQGSGFSVKLTTDTGAPFPDMAQIIQQNWKDIGLDVELQALRYPVYSQLVEQGKLPVWPSGWFMVFPTPADKVDGEYTSNASGNSMNYSNPEVDRLAAQADQTFDDAERNQIYAQIEQLVGEDAPELFLISTTFWTTVSDKLQNWHWRGEYGSYFDRIWIAS